MDIDEKIKKLEQQIEELKEELKQQERPFNRVVSGENYYFIDKYGNISTTAEGNPFTYSNYLYDVANYCANKEIMKQRALHETLNRLLWRFSMQNGGDKIDWGSNTEICLIYWNNNKHCFSTFYDSHHPNIGTVYFINKGIAQRAIEEIIKPFVASHLDFKF